jgi:hypothetical protein
MTVGTGELDCTGAASMRRKTSGAPAADPADRSGPAAGSIGVPGSRGESAVCESGAAGDPLPASGSGLAIALAAGAVRASIGAAAIPRDTRLKAGTTLALS